MNPTIEMFNNEINIIIKKTLHGEKQDFSRLREICKNMEVGYDFKVDADDETFWQACCQYTKELVSNS